MYCECRLALGSARNIFFQQHLNSIGINRCPHTEPPHIRDGTPWVQSGIPYNDVMPVELCTVPAEPWEEGGNRIYLSSVLQPRMFPFGVLVGRRAAR